MGTGVCGGGGEGGRAVWVGVGEGVFVCMEGGALVRWVKVWVFRGGGGAGYGSDVHLGVCVEGGGAGYGSDVHLGVCVEGGGGGQSHAET